MYFKDLKLGTKQMIGFGFILLIMTAANFFSINRMKSIKAEFAIVTTNWLPRAMAVSDINLYTSDLRLNQLQHAFATDEKSRQAQAEKMILLIDNINESLDIYDSLKTDSEQRHLYSDIERQLFSEFDQKWDDYQALSFMFFRFTRENKRQKAVELLNGEAQDVFNDFSEILIQIVGIYEKDVFASTSRVEKAFKTTRIVAMSLLITTVALSFLFAIILIRWITVPIHQLEKAAKTVAEGDLSFELDILSKDEIGNLSRSFNSMTTSLRKATERLKSQAEKLQKQAVNLKATNKELQNKSVLLEKQKTEIVQKNLDLYSTMEELESTQEQLLMKEKITALGDLVAGVAHEINNPIGVVLSSQNVADRCIHKIELLLGQSTSIEKLKGDQDLAKSLKILKDSSSVILTASNRIVAIVKSLKNFARLDEAEYQLVDIHEGINSSLTLLGTEIQQRISVVKEYGDVPKIDCNPGQLNQVFINVLKNAAQAIEEHGEIHIKTFLQDSKIYVQISDTGKGITNDKLKKIFDFSFSSEKKRVKLGSGLATAYNIVQKHKGEILVESEIGKGSIVSVILPKTQN